MFIKDIWFTFLHPLSFLLDHWNYVMGIPPCLLLIYVKYVCRGFLSMFRKWLTDEILFSTGTVDDHFAKSLGSNMWSALKAKNDPDVQTVDDHFAKALGTSTWLRIKKEKETNGGASPPSSPQQQRPNSSLVST